jgi:hypothetical protein
MDGACNSLIHGVEGGLPNVKPQFAAAALEETGQKLVWYRPRGSV